MNPPSIRYSTCFDKSNFLIYFFLSCIYTIYVYIHDICVNSKKPNKKTLKYACAFAVSMIGGASIFAHAHWL